MSERVFVTGRPLEAETVFVAADRLAALQWEAYLAAGLVSRGRRAWAGPTVVSYAAWSAEMWSSGPDAPERMLLAPGQSRALWRQVIAESPEGGRLLGIAGAARWAEDAWRRVRGWRVDLRRFDAERSSADFAAFLTWSRTYSERLAAARWLDAAELDDALASSPSRPAEAIVLADFEPTPSQEALVERLRALGGTFEWHAPPVVPGQASQACFGDSLDELCAAAAWAASRLRVDPDARVAIVVGDLDQRAAEVGRALDRQLGGGSHPPLFVAARPAGAADARPLIGAALNAIALLSPNADFGTFSRWLRSPWFHGDGPESLAEAARLEARLRNELAAQLPFLEAYRRAGVRERLLGALPEAAARFDAALAALGDARAERSPAEWSRLWTAILERLGWRGWSAGSPDGTETERQPWEEALNALALLTPIVGRIGPMRALAELEAAVERSLPAPPLPIAGVHVLGDVADVGPGYAAAWVTGMSETAYPRPARLNPLLPRRLQVEYRMPWSSPQDALARSRALVARLIGRVPEAVFSWPERVRDETAGPSPLIGRLPELTAGCRTAPAPRSPVPAPAPPAPAPRAPASPPRVRARETVPDPAPPLESRTLQGGTGALNAQAACPLRAFAEYRLGARVLEPVERGVPPRVQGIVLHAALERLYRRFDGRTALAEAPAAALEEAVRRCAETAAAEAFGESRTALAALRELESERVAALLRRFIAKELERAPFRVEALEREQAIEVAGRTIRSRIDRIDELADGTVAVIDYKSGRGAQAASWFAPRPRDLQLPVYALCVPERVSALVIATIRADTVGYAGVWHPSDAFPGRPRRSGESGGLAGRLDTWREAVAALVGEYAAGDARFFTADVEPASGAYAPLTRVYEQLALHRGWLPVWERR